MTTPDTPLLADEPEATADISIKGPAAVALAEAVRAWFDSDPSALRGEVERLTAAVDTYEQECRKLNQTIDTLADDVTRLARERDEAHDAREFSDGMAAAALEDRDRWLDKAKKRKGQRDELAAELAQVHGLAKLRKKQRDEAQAAKLELYDELEKLTAERDQARAERDAMRPVVEAAGAEVAEMLAWQAGGEYRRLTDPEDVALVKAWRAYEAWRAGNCSAETETQPNGHVRVTEMVAYQNSSAPPTTSAGSTLHVRWDNDPDPDSPVTSVWESGDAPNPAPAEDDEVYRVAAKAWADGFDEMSTAAQLRAAVDAVRPIIEAQALRRAADRIEDDEPYAAAQLRDWADETGGASRG